MSTIYKKFGPNDITNVRSVLHELVPANGSLFWNVYGSYPDNTNIKKTIPTKMFEEVFDAPVNFSSANKICDISLMVSEKSSIFDVGLGYNASYDSYASTRKNAYRSIALQHLGGAVDGQVVLFDKDGDFYSSTNDKYKELIVLSFSRLMFKDAIKKGSFRLVLALHPKGFDPAGGFLPNDNYVWDGSNSTSSLLEITDYLAESNYKVNSLVGDYGILYAQQPISSPILQNVVAGQRIAVGLIFYNTGVILLNPYLFWFNDGGTGPGLLNKDGVTLFNMLYDSTGSYSAPTSPASYYDIVDLMSGYDIGGSDKNLTILNFADAFRSRIHFIEFQNTIELNSTVYFCRINHNEFNYSSNPTYLEGSRVRVKKQSSDSPVAYITGVGLYGKDGELLAVAKVSEPIRKSTDVDLTLRVRLDF